ncbi:MAG TPA: asparagine synthase (glutamine-hydrolyzing) [Steroidobacteraceae bacterium]|jgi:asparagine synthase (glutamine-hydrolysing)|nr:asparagine synthase (glutamine-hydrolyzing) [Steroidobacteraceae bacterium]
MCGLAGFLTLTPVSAGESEARLRRMAQAMLHRGPDAEGVWSDATAGIGLAHRRLSIIDLSPQAAQPMLSESGRWVISFNGEIYNYAALRTELEQIHCRFRSSSDTEVLLNAIERWGLEVTLGRARGMFALAAWDRRERALYLARDRFGEKPLHFGRCGRTLLFGSELKSLRTHPAWNAPLNRDSLALLLRHYYIPAPHTIYSGVHKVLPGSYVRFTAQDGELREEQHVYWKARPLARCVDPAGAPADAEVVERLHATFAEAVKLQMVADVPVGAFLSGGIDSSLIVALMQQVSSRPVRTFSIGFADPEFDETPFARRIAAHLGTEHTELHISSRSALDVIPSLPDIYDEPFADPSQIPTWLVSRLARQSVTVSLSGDGGDELFGGYQHYTTALQYWRRVQRVPSVFRALLRNLGTLPLPWLQVLASPALVGPWRMRPHLADRIKERSSQLFAPNFYHLYRTYVSFWHNPEDVVLGAREPRTVLSDYDAKDGLEAVAHMMYMDTRQYLPDDILVKVDRAAMSVSLETRVPMLDPQVAELAWATPLAVHHRDGRGKWLLRQLLARYVPTRLFDRPKRGFSIPLAQWLRGELRPWAEHLLEPARLRREGVFEPNVIERRWRQHLAGLEDWSIQLWTVLMAQAWLERWQP